MKVIEFNVEAKKLGIPIMSVFKTYEQNVESGKAFGVITPSKTELVSYEPAELEALIFEVSNGKISLTYLAEHLNLNTYQVHSIMQQLPKTGKINGELTYNAFISANTSRKEMLQKSKAHKREHRLRLRQKHQKPRLKSA